MGVLLISVSLRTAAPGGVGPQPVVGLALMMGSFVTVMCTVFAGAGIVSQGAFQFLKGQHGSTQVTLSLPVSRLHLLTVRAALGWAEMAAVLATFCGGVWVVARFLTGGATALRMLEYAATLVVCTSALYFFSVLMATFLDDQWRSWATMAACVTIWGLPHVASVPSFVDIFGAMGEQSPLVTHTMPWSVMAFSGSLAALLFVAAVRVVRRREY
jgi:hypothetical protein